MIKTTIYVRLLDEGTEVYRPVDALYLGGTCYQMGGFDIHDSEDELWEFPPGSRVETTSKYFEDQVSLVAIALCP